MTRKTRDGRPLIRSRPGERTERLEFVRELVAHRDELGERVLMALLRRHLGPMSLPEIAIVLGTTKQGVSHTETVALRKLREAFEAIGVRSGDDVAERTSVVGPMWRHTRSR